MTDNHHNGKCNQRNDDHNIRKAFAPRPSPATPCDVFLTVKICIHDFLRLILPVYIKSKGGKHSEKRYHDKLIFCRRNWTNDNRKKNNAQQRTKLQKAILPSNNLWQPLCATLVCLSLSR